MKRVRIPGLGVALLLAAAPGAFAQNAGKLYDELPGMGKPVRSGYVITTEGGVEGPQTVHYENAESRKGKGPGRDPNDRRGMGPVASNDNSGIVNTGGRSKNDGKVADPAAYEADPVVGRLSGKNDDIAGRRFDRTSSGRFSKDEKFDSSGRPDFGRWGREDERRDPERGEYFGAGERYDTSARPAFGMWGASDDRFERKDYSGSGARADVRNWNELFSRDKNARYADRSVSSALTGHMNDTLDRMRAYEQASMQAINRTAFRRSHSDNAGELPVAPVGKGDAGVKPMRASPR